MEKEPTARGGPMDTIPGIERPDDLATPEFIAALLVDGDDDMAAWAIGQALAERPRAQVYDDVVRGAMQLVGSGWEHGRWTVSHEHLASVALAAALARLRPAEPAATGVGPLAILAAPAGEEHVSGLACLAQILEDHGWRVENLGANVPPDDLRAFVAQREVDLVGLTVGTRQRLASLQRTVDALRAEPRTPTDVPIIVGGRGTIGARADIRGADLVTDKLVDAERFAADLERRR